MHCHERDTLVVPSSPVDYYLAPENDRITSRDRVDSTLMDAGTYVHVPACYIYIYPE